MQLIGDVERWKAVSATEVRQLPTEQPNAPLTQWIAERAASLCSEYNDAVVIEAAVVVTQGTTPAPVWQPWPLEGPLPDGNHAVAAAVAVALPGSNPMVYLETRVVVPSSFGVYVAYSQAMEAARSLAFQHVLPTT
jgi:hypothetical protein